MPLLVLIETLWNVKHIEPVYVVRYAPVLIETLWNVKSVVFTLIIFYLLVLIETLWNVKSEYLLSFDVIDDLY